MYSSYPFLWLHPIITKLSSEHVNVPTEIVAAAAVVVTINDMKDNKDANFVIPCGMLLLNSPMPSPAAAWSHYKWMPVPARWKTGDSLSSYST